VNIRQEIKELKTGARDLRKFGLLVGGVAILLGVNFLLRHKASYAFLLWPGLILFVVGAVWPRALKYPYLAWMTMAFAIGFVMARVILTVFFFVLLTPIGLLARLFGKDFLSLKWDRQATSYWIPCKTDPKRPESYQQQY
jgi:hypothetical protein